MVQLGRHCPKLLKMVNNRPHATDKDHEPDAKKEDCKEMTEAEVNQSPRSSISDGKFSSKEEDMFPDAESLSNAPRYAADISTCLLKGGSDPKDFDSWESQSQRKSNRNTYRARNKTTHFDNIHASDHRQSNKRKRSTSHSTEGRSVRTLL